MTSLLNSTESIATERAHSDVEHMFRTALDMLPTGILLVDANARIFHANAAAEHMLSANEPIRRCQGRLMAGCMIATEALTAATRAVTQSEASCLTAGSSVPLPSRDGRVAVAHVRRLNAHEPRSMLDHSLAAAIFITVAKRAAEPPLDALARLFELTRSEARVLQHIVAGRRRREAAAALGVAHSTVSSAGSPASACWSDVATA